MSDDLPIIGRLSFFGFIKLLIFSNIRNKIIQQIKFDRFLQLFPEKGIPDNYFFQPPVHLLPDRIEAGEIGTVRFCFGTCFQRAFHFCPVCQQTIFFTDTTYLFPNPIDSLKLYFISCFYIHPVIIISIIQVIKTSLCRLEHKLYASA